MSRRRIALKIYGALVLVFLVSPTLIIVPMSFSGGRTLAFPPKEWSLRWYENLLESERWADATLTSAQVAVLAMVLALLLGVPASIALHRGDFPGKSFLQLLVLSPLLVPLVIVAIGTFSVFVTWNLTGSVLGMALAHAVLAVPFVVVNVLASLAGMDPDVETAASSLGAGPFQIFATVTLPLIAPGVAAGALFSFVTSWDEVVLAIFLNSPKVRTLPVVMWNQVRTEVDPTIAAAASLLTLATTAVFLIGSIVVANRSKEIRGVR